MFVPDHHKKVTCTGHGDETPSPAIAASTPLPVVATRVRRGASGGGVPDRGELMAERKRAKGKARAKARAKPEAPPVSRVRRVRRGAAARRGRR
jgi:hypothetical protein